MTAQPSAEKPSQRDVEKARWAYFPDEIPCSCYKGKAFKLCILHKQIAHALSETRAEGVKDGLERAAKITELAFRHICRGTDCCSEFQQKEIAQAIRKEKERG